MANQPTKYKKFLAGAASATLVATAIVPTALAADATTAATDFSDVAANHTHYAAIMQAVERGLFDGYTDGTFKPENTIDRKGVAKSLAKYVVSQSEYKTFEEYITANKLVEKVTPFNDVPATHGDAELFNASLIVKDSGIFTGSNNNLMPANVITRQQMAKVLVNGFGLKDLAGVESEVTDTDKAQAEYVNFINILSENGVTEVTTYNPTGAVKRGQMASFLNRSYDSAHKVVAPETATKVVSVSATNLKEIVVAFDGEVNETTAENKDAYVVKKGLSLVAIDSAELQADGKTVILTVNSESPNTALTNQSKEYTLSVDGIKAGDKVVSVKDFAFTPLDQALPTVESVTGLGNKAVKITFNEPVKLSGTVASAFKIDDKVVSGIATTTGRTVTIELFSTLSDGSHELTVNNNVVDFANYQLVETSKTFDVVADTVAPTIVSVKDATLEGVTVVFSEDIKKAEAELASNYFWKSGATKKVATKATLLTPTTVRVSFTGNPLPGYATDLFVTNVSDYSSNKIAADSKVSVTAQLDQARPEVLTSKYDNSTKKLSVTFSKDIKASSFKASNVVVKDKDGKVVTNGYTGSVVNNKLDVSFSTALKPGTYTLELNGLTDTTLLANAMLPYTTDVVVTNLQAPIATSLNGTGSSYVLSFDKVMDTTTTNSVLNPENYFVTYLTNETTPRTITGKLPNGTNLSPTNGNKGVIIQLPSGVAKITSLTVQGVKDADGNFISNYAKTFNEGDINAKISTLGAKATGKKTILVKLDQPLGYVNKADFALSGANLNGATISTAVIDSADNTVVKLTLNQELNASVNDVKVTVNDVAASSKTVGITGSTLDNSGALTVQDAIAASVKSDDEDITIETVAAGAANGSHGLEVADVAGAAHTITVNFDEAITASNLTKLDDNFLVYKADGTALEYGIDYTIAEDIQGTPSASVTIELVDAQLVGYDGTLQVVFNNDNGNITDATTAVDFNGTTAINTAAIEFDTATDATADDRALISYNETLAYVSGALSADKKVATLTFDDVVVSKVADLKAEVTVGATPLAAGDTVVIDGNKLVVTFATPLTTGTHALTVAAGAITDDADNDLASNAVYSIVLP